MNHLLGLWIFVVIVWGITELVGKLRKTPIKNRLRNAAIASLTLSFLSVFGSYPQDVGWRLVDTVSLVSCMIVILALYFSRLFLNKLLQDK